jgi:hypothetical protein
MPRQSSSKKHKRKQRFQLQQKFWLNALDADESALAKWCDGLREKRRFTPVVRNGLMLMHELERGDMEFLFNLFPKLYEELYAHIEAEVLGRRDAEAINRLSKLEQMIENLSLPAPAVAPQLGTGGIRSLQIPTSLPGSVEDDEEDSILTAVAAQVDGSAIAANFLRSLQGI